MTLTAVTPSEALREARDRFEGLDWNFTDAKGNVGLHGIHPYPAKFVPQLPRHLLELFHPVVGGPVLDPFCGSGTTLVECQARGIPSFGIDLNPIATLVSRVKTHPPKQSIAPIAAQLAKTAAIGQDAAVPDIPRLHHWFTPGGATALAKLTCGLTRVADPRSQDSLQVALSRIIVRVSRQESDTRYAAVHCSVEEADVYELFVQSAEALDDVFSSSSGDTNTPSGVLTKDILLVDPDDLPRQFGLIITSPPYPNAYEYWLYHKYRMYWLGQDPIAVRAAEIGARYHYFTRQPATSEDFREQMARCFKLFQAITLPEAIVCIVIGRSIIRGEVVDNSIHLRSAASQHGFRCLTSATREIPRTRKSFNPSHGNISAETILVFYRRNR